MAMDGSDQRTCSSPSSSSHDDGRQEGVAVWSKRPAGRTKFKETRHPVYRGVRHRGAAGRWVCEVRVPGAHGKRLWLGTHLTAESAGRAHDAAMLALLPSGAACLLNFPDSAAATPSCAAALVAVAGFLSREAAAAAVPEVISIVSVVVPVAVVPVDNGAAAAAVPEVISIVSVVVPVAVVPVDNGAAGAWPSFLGVFEVVTPIAMVSDMLELDMPSEMDLGMHYADLAEGLLMEPPPDAAGASCWESGDYGHGDAGDLWSY